MDSIIERMNRRGISTSSIQTGVYKFPSTGCDEKPVANGTMKHFSATVVFLDDSTQRFSLDKKARGQDLLNLVFSHLELSEREYFGLMFTDTGVAVPPGHAPDIMRWLDPNKSIRKQMRIKGLAACSLYFRVKFYVTDPSRLHEEYTRYHVYLQVKNDLSLGRLVAPISTVCLLTSYSVQSTLGDYDPDSCRHGYLAQFKNLRAHCTHPPNSKIDTDELDRKVAELHKLHKGQSPAESEMNFLEHAKRLEMYGISLHNGTDTNGRDIQLGVTSIGLVVFQNFLKINTFSWSKIVKISFKRKQFFIQLRKELTESYDTLLGFNLSSYRSCKNLWKSAVEHHSFFRLQSPKLASKKFPFSLSSKFRYSGRTEFQTVSESGQEQSKSKWDRAFFRSPSKKFLRQTLPVNLDSTRTPIRNLLASPEHSSIGSSTHGSTHSNGVAKPVSMSSSTLKPVPSQQVLNGSRVSLAVRAYESFNHRVQSLGGRAPRKAWADDNVSDDEGGFLSVPRAGTVPRTRAPAPSAAELRHSRAQSSTPSQSHASHVSVDLSKLSHASGDISKTSTDLSHPPNKLAFMDDSASERGSQGAGSSQVSTASTARLTLPLTTPPCATPPHDDATSQLSGSSGATSTATTALVIVTITPDQQGRFGFNVKGGADQGVPVIVSRVAGGTPADRCLPRLNEGDQVVVINGRDISTMTHDQVVNFIRASREPHSGHLVLAVRQNVYFGEDVEEPAFQYVPEKRGPSSIGAEQATPLAQSLLLLDESLESGAITGQFEQLYRRNPTLAVSECHLSENVAKNRYKDISPYDSTRVILSDCPTGDYINANHVVMEIPGSGIVNRYIATQGPLSSTCIDFWYMIWEQESSLVIMLTTVVERGRIKCHKYWPATDETVLYGSVSVTCTRDESHDSFAFRDFTLTHADCDQTRVVTQMQYLSWPDHGTPDSPGEFVEFVEVVRETREKSAAITPTVVHCSAGIGRTGVLILMETAACLVEANQPVYPLDLTRVMRDQRPAMIQTPSQYKFVCEAISSVYREGRIKPLPEFHQS